MRDFLQNLLSALRAWAWWPSEVARVPVPVAARSPRGRR
jgi:hypothetical protein